MLHALVAEALHGRPCFDFSELISILSYQNPVTMKTLRLTAGLMLILSASIFTSCTKDQNETYESTTREFISQGKWSVDYFYAGSDRTAQFTNYQFNFLGNGTLTGTTGTNDFSGTWTVIRDVNYNDVLKITIQSADPQILDLNEQWNVVEKNNRLISMKDDNNQLRFKKL